MPMTTEQINYAILQLQKCREEEKDYVEKNKIDNLIAVLVNERTSQELSSKA